MEQGSVAQTVELDGDASRPLGDIPTYNYHLSGSYQGVMAARGDLLREAPRDNRLSVRIARTDLLESPLAEVSQIKPDVLRRLEDIALDSKARLTIVTVPAHGSGNAGGTVLATLDGQSLQRIPSNGQDRTTQAPGHDRTGSGDSSVAGSVQAEVASTSANELSAEDARPATNGTQKAASENGKGASVKSSSNDSYGLETQRMCEIVVTGSMESVHLGLRGCLIMQDQLVRISQSPWKDPALIVSVRSTRRGLRDGLQATAHRRGTAASPHPSDPGGDRYQHLLADSSSWCPRRSPSGFPARCRLPTSRYSYATAASALAHTTHDAADRTVDVQHGWP